MTRSSPGCTWTCSNGSRPSCGSSSSSRSTHRTGIAAALLLGLLGVAEDVILDDYELTSVYWGARRMDALASVMAEHGVPEERVRPLVEARRPVLAAVLSHID